MNKRLKRTLTSRYLLLLIILNFVLFTGLTSDFESFEDKGIIGGFNILQPPNDCGSLDYDFCKSNFISGDYTNFYKFYVEWAVAHSVSFPLLDRKKVILRNPKVITYWSPNRPTLYALENIAKLVNETNAFVAVNVRELENLLIKNNHNLFKSNELPYLILYEGFPYELLLNYPIDGKKGSDEKDVAPYILTYISPNIPLFYNNEEDYANESLDYIWQFNLPHYLDFGSEGEEIARPKFNLSLIYGYNPSKITSFNFFQFFSGSDIESAYPIGVTVVNVSWVNKTSKRNYTLEGFYIKYPYGFSVFYPTNVTNSTVSRILGIENVKDAFSSGGYSFYFKFGRVNEIESNATKRFENNTACVY